MYYLLGPESGRDHYYMKILDEFRRRFEYRMYANQITIQILKLKFNNLFNISSQDERKLRQLSHVFSKHRTDVAQSTKVKDDLQAEAMC